MRNEIRTMISFYDLVAASPIKCILPVLTNLVETSVDGVYYRAQIVRALIAYSSKNTSSTGDLLHSLFKKTSRTD